MNDSSLRSNQTTLWASWVITSIVGWAASHSALQIPSLKSSHEITPWIAAILVDGILIGTIITFGQWFILQNIFPGFTRGFLFIAFLYPIGLLVSFLVFSFWGLADLEKFGGTVLIISSSKTLIGAGVTISLGQWLVLRSYLTPNFQSGALWVLGTVAGLVLGGFYGGGHLSFGLYPPTLSQSVRDILGGAFTGLASGSIIGGIFLILFRQARKVGCEAASD